MQYEFELRTLCVRMPMRWVLGFGFRMARRSSRARAPRRRARDSDARAAMTTGRKAPAPGATRATTRATTREDALDRALRALALAKSFLSSYDARDKTLAFAQYATLCASNGAPGKLTSASASIGMSRKPFRIVKPLESAATAARKRASDAPTSAAETIRALGMTCYFAFDHLVWACASGACGTGKEDARGRFQRLSYWGWFFGSASGLFLDTNELNALLDVMREKGFGEDGNAPKTRDGENTSPFVDADEDLDADEREAREREVEALRKRARKVFVGLITNSAQAILALALLEKVKMSKRKIGALGMFLSAVNIASMLPAPAAEAPGKTKTA